MTDAERGKILREIYSEAEKVLRERHLDEFNQIRSDLASARGIDWTPKQSEEEKAAATIAELLAKFPDLVTQFNRTEM